MHMPNVARRYLHLDLPAFAWKLLANCRVVPEDVWELDVLLMSSMSRLRVIESEGVSAASFADVFPLTFTYAAHVFS